METREGIFQPGEGGRELVEHDAVVLHLGAEPCGLEHAFAVPVQVEGLDGRVRRCLVGQRCVGDQEGETQRGGQRRQRGVEPFVQGRQIVRIQQDTLGDIDQPVVLGMEDMVDGSQRDVLVTASVTTDKVHAEQLIVIETGGRVGADSPGGLAADHVGAGVERLYAGYAGFEIDTRGIHVGRTIRRRRMGHVEEEAVVDTQRDAGIHRRGHIAFDQGGRAVQGDRGHQLRQAARRTGDELAVRVGQDHRDIGAVAVVKIEAELQAALCLGGIPGRHAAVVRGVENAVIAEAIEQMTGGLQDAAPHLVMTQQDLGRSMRAVGLLLIHMGRRGVDERIVFGAQDAVRTHAPRRAGHDHHIGGARRRVKQRIVRLEWYGDKAVAALVDQAETVVEELTEEGHEGVERCREALVRRRVGNEKLVLAGDVRADVRTAFGGRGINRRRVADRLVDNQVADQARRGIRHVRGAVIGGAVLGIRKDPLGQIRNFQVGRTEAFLARNQVIEGTVHRTQTPGNGGVRQDVEQVFTRGMPLGNFDLLEDEIQISCVEGQIRVRRLRVRGLRYRPANQNRRA